MALTTTTPHGALDIAEFAAPEPSRPPREDPRTGAFLRTARPRVSVIIPAKDEGPNIARVLARLPRDVDEIVLVDGQSTDHTVATARAVRPDLRVVDERGPGKGSALRAGFESATGEIIVMLDADDSMEPAEMSRHLALLESGFDLVKGSRFMAGGDSTDITGIRRIGNRMLVGLVNAMFRTKFTDLCYGFCAFHRSHVEALALDAPGFEIETQLVLRAVRLGLAVSEVPSCERPRATGESHLRTFRDGMRVLRTLASEFVRPAPILSQDRPPGDIIDLRDAPLLPPLSFECLTAADQPR